MYGQIPVRLETKAKFAQIKAKTRLSLIEVADMLATQYMTDHGMRTAKSVRRKPQPA